MLNSVKESVISQAVQNAKTKAKNILRQLSGSDSWKVTNIMLLEEQSNGESKQ